MDINAIQLKWALLEAASAMKPSGFQWEQALPIFLSSFLGIFVGVLLEHFKRWLDRRKDAVMKKRDELVSINGVLVGITYNVEMLLHTTFQSVLPHFEQSQAAYDALSVLQTDLQYKEFMYNLSEHYPALTMTCPKQNFIEANFIEHLPFLIALDPQLVKDSGWMRHYSRLFDAAANDRNREIAAATALLHEQGGQLNVHVLRSIIQMQCAISIAECVNAFELFRKFSEIAARLQSINVTYGKYGNPTKIHFPPALKDAVEALRQVHTQATARMPGGQIPPEPQGPS